MRIGLITQYFPPDSGSAAHRASMIYQLPYDFTVVCPQINRYPFKKKERVPCFQQTRTTKNNNDKIISTYIYTAIKKNLFTQFLYYLSFFFSMFMAKKELKKCDVIVAITAPISVGVGASILAKLLKKRFILEVQDIWPQAVFAAKIFSKNSIAGRLSLRLARFVYRSADHIVAITPGIKKYLTSLGYGDKITLVLPAFTALEREMAAANNLGEGIIYAGTINRMHDEKAIIKVAEANPDMHLYVYAQKPVKGYNITYCGWFETDKKALFHSIMDSRFALVTLADNETNKMMALPYKMVHYMLLRKPIIYLGGGDGLNIIINNMCGTTNYKGLSHIPINVVQQWGINARNYADEHFSPEKFTKKYTSILEGRNDSWSD